jgi:hypothetical protein
VEHCPRALVLAGVGQRLDQLGGDGEHARLPHALAVEVLPRGAERRGRPLGLASEQRRDPERPVRLQPVPARADGLGPLDRVRGPALGLLRVPETGIEQRAAALVHRPDQQLPLG